VLGSNTTLVGFCCGFPCLLASCWHFDIAKTQPHEFRCLRALQCVREKAWHHLYLHTSINRRLNMRFRLLMILNKKIKRGDCCRLLRCYVVRGCLLLDRFSNSRQRFRCRSSSANMVYVQVVWAFRGDWPCLLLMLIGCLFSVKNLFELFVSLWLFSWGWGMRCPVAFHVFRRVELNLEQWCCNLSVGVALNVWFTTNGMCAKNNIHTYVARTSNNKWSWRVISHDTSMWTIERNYQHARRVIMACDLYCCHSVKLCALAVRAFRSQQWHA